MDRAKSFEDLLVWKKAHLLTLDIYKITNSFPKSEQFGLTSQMRRAAYSVPSNIAEGFAKNGVKDKLRFYNIAQGSLQELKYFVLLSSDLNYRESFASLSDLVNEVGKMLNGYISKIKSNL